MLLQTAASPLLDWELVQTASQPSCSRLDAWPSEGSQVNTEQTVSSWMLTELRGCIGDDWVKKHYS